MYINPFWCGVFATIGIEALVFFVWIIYLGMQSKEKGDKDEKR